MSNAHKPAKCRECKTTNVTWKQSKAGKWYLADINHGIRGSVYYSPHFQTCTERGPKADQLRAIAAHNEAVEAKHAAQRATIAALVANRASIDELMAADASFNDIVAAGITVEELVNYYNQKGV